jgi:hypothetical protein
VKAADSTAASATHSYACAVIVEVTLPDYILVVPYLAIIDGSNLLRADDTGRWCCCSVHTACNCHPDVVLQPQ